MKVLLKVFLALSVVFLLIVTIRFSIDSHTYKDGSYVLGQGVLEGWQQLCVFGQHELPQATAEGYSTMPCVLESSVPGKTVLFAYFYSDKACQAVRVRGYFLGKLESETRCLTSTELDNFQLKYSDDVYFFEFAE